jgi:hypothetical protein
MWEPRRLTTLWVFTACYKDSSKFFFFSLLKCLLKLLIFKNMLNVYYVAASSQSSSVYLFCFLHVSLLLLSSSSSSPSSSRRQATGKNTRSFHVCCNEVVESRAAFESKFLRRVHITRARARARQACNSTHRISAAASMCTVTSLASTSTSNVDAPLLKPFVTFLSNK